MSDAERYEYHRRAANFWGAMLLGFLLSEGLTVIWLLRGGCSP